MRIKSNHAITEDDSYRHFDLRDKQPMSFLKNTKSVLHLAIKGLHHAITFQ